MYPGAKNRHKTKKNAHVGYILATFDRQHAINRGIVAGFVFCCIIIVGLSFMQYHNFADTLPTTPPTSIQSYILPGGNIPTPTTPYMSSGADTGENLQGTLSGSSINIHNDETNGVQFNLSGAHLHTIENTTVTSQALGILNDIILHSIYTTSINSKSAVSSSQITNNITHASGPTYGYDEYRLLCKVYNVICNKMEYRGRITPHQQVITLGFAIHLTNFLDTHLQAGNITNTITKIAIDGGQGKRRGLSSHTKTVLYLGSMQTDQEIREVFTHELGHILDLGVLEGKSNKLDSTFTEFGNIVFFQDDPSFEFYTISWLDEYTRRAPSTPQHFVSGYAMTNPFEDFAESFNMYINHYPRFASYSQDKILQKKKTFFDSLLGNRSLTKGEIKGISYTSYRSRDTTRLNQS